MFGHPFFSWDGYFPIDFKQLLHVDSGLSTHPPPPTCLLRTFWSHSLSYFMDRLVGRVDILMLTNQLICDFLLWIVLLGLCLDVIEKPQVTFWPSQEKKGITTHGVIWVFLLH